MWNRLWLHPCFVIIRMKKSTLSPSERAARKRENARLRQQRCRARKREAKLKQSLERKLKNEDKRTRVVVNMNSKVSIEVPLTLQPTFWKSCNDDVESEQHADPPMPPLTVNTKPTSPRPYYATPTAVKRADSQSIPASLTWCESSSFPSLKSESSRSRNDSPSYEEEGISVLHQAHPHQHKDNL